MDKRVKRDKKTIVFVKGGGTKEDRRALISLLKKRDDVMVVGNGKIPEPDKVIESIERDGGKHTTVVVDHSYETLEDAHEFLQDCMTYICVLKPMNEDRMLDKFDMQATAAEDYDFKLIKKEQTLESFAALLV